MSKIFRPRAQRLIEYCKSFNVSPGTLIEIGAAFGTFCEAVKECSFFEEIIALEPTPGLAETCRQRGFKTLETTIEQLEDESVADVATAFEVIEHLHDPAEFIQQCKKILRPNGLLILSCPNVKGFDACVLDVQSSMFDHEHLNYFSPESLNLLLEKNGFEVLDISTPGKLDVDLVRNYVVNNHQEDILDNFLSGVILGDQAIRNSFQSFITANRLSSHMWAVAKLKG